MLQQAHLLALNHRIGLLMLQKHTNHRGLGHIGMDSGNHLQIAGVTHHVFRKTGAVVVIDLQDPVADKTRASGRRKYRQIAALGMTTQAEKAVKLRSHLPGIVQRHTLGRNRLLEAHIEILFPTNQGIIRAPKGQKGRPVVQEEGCRRKLGLLLLQKQLPEEEELCLSKPLRIGSFAQKLQIVFHPHSFLVVIHAKKGIRSLLQRNGDSGLESYLSSIADIRQCRKNQRVHRVQRVH